MKTTTEDEVKAYFTQLGPVLDLEIRTDKNKNPLAFFVTVNSPKVIAKISSSSVHKIGESKCVLVKSNPAS